jgi:hypothetical protein
MPKAPSKKKSKAVPIVAVVGSDGSIQGSFTAEPRRPLIVHLPFRSNEVKFQDGPLVYDPNPPAVPEPYDASADNLYSSNAEVLTDDTSPFNGLAKVEQKALPSAVSESSNVNTVQDVTVTVDDKPMKAFRTMDCMIEFRAANESNTIPESTTAASNPG